MVYSRIHVCCSAKDTRGGHKSPADRNKRTLWNVDLRVIDCGQLGHPLNCHCPGGLVVKGLPEEWETRGSLPAFPGCHTSDLEAGTLLATLSDAWR